MLKFLLQSYYETKHFFCQRLKLKKLKETKSLLLHLSRKLRLEVALAIRRLVFVQILRIFIVCNPYCWLINLKKYARYLIDDDGFSQFEGCVAVKRVRKC